MLYDSQKAALKLEYVVYLSLDLFSEILCWLTYILSAIEQFYQDNSR